MTPPDVTGASVRRPTQPTVERPETPPSVRNKLAEGELADVRLAGRVDVLFAKQDALAEGQRALRQDVSELREALREHERANAERDRETRAEMRGMREGMEGMREDMDARLDRIERALAVQVEVSRVPTTEPTLPALHPITSTGQARRAAAVGGGGLTLATVLGVVASIGQLPAPLQWGMVGLAILAGLGALAVAVRWGWRAAGR